MLLVAIITLGCSNESSTKNSTESIKLKNKFIPIINGYWVESSYIDSVSITKSPCKSANAVKPIVELFIDCAKINGDSILVAAPSIHEGGYLFYVHLRTDITKKGLLITSEFETDESFYKELNFV
ncbi:MAG: hypothetical protein ABL940_09515, partial [Bacteroidia bacterium]